MEFFPRLTYRKQWWPPIDRRYYVTRRRFGFPRSVAFFNSSKLNSFVRCREPRLLSRGETLHTCLSSPRFELQILLNPATKGRRTTGESLGIALLFEASRLLKCAPSHVFEKFHFGLWIEKRNYRLIYVNFQICEIKLIYLLIKDENINNM